MTTTVHPRTEVREAVIAALTNATDAEGRVASSKVTPWRAADCPAIAVYTPRERVDPDSAHTGPRVLTRLLDVVIEGAMRLPLNGPPLADSLDAFGWQIERVMHADRWFGGLIADSILQSTELELTADGDQPIGIVRLVYGIEYQTDAPAAEDQPLNDLKTIDATYPVTGRQTDTVDPEDTLTGLDT